MKRNEYRKKSSGKGLRAAMAIAVILGLMALAPMATAMRERDLEEYQAQTVATATNENPGIFISNDKPFEMTYGEAGVKWWQWALSIPAATNPLLDTTGEFCSEGQTGPVWFLAGTTGGPATRTCTVPTGKALFFPILNVFAGAAGGDCEPSVPGVACDVDKLRAAAAFLMNNPALLEASIDGVPLQDLIQRGISPQTFSITVPDDYIFSSYFPTYTPGTYKPHVSDGYWVMLAPLSEGEHTIHFKGVTNPAIGFETEVTYKITVAPN